MEHFATKCMNAHEDKAKKRALDAEITTWSKGAKGDLEQATAFGIALLTETGMELPLAASRMLGPEVSVMLESCIERAVKILYESMDYNQAKNFNEAVDLIEAIPVDAIGHLALWAFEDGSAWVALSAHPREMAQAALASISFEGRDEVNNQLERLWGPMHAPLGYEVGVKFAQANAKGYPLVSLNAKEAEAFYSGVAASWAEGVGGSWGKGLTMKSFLNGSQFTPADLVKNSAKALRKGKDALVKLGIKRAEEVRKQRDSSMKVHWRDAMCMFLSQTNSAPSYDGGVAAFLMSKPGLFGTYPLPVWRKIFNNILELLKPLSEGESPELIRVEASVSILGGDTASQLAHFLYRYHRSGGAKVLAKCVLGQVRERLTNEEVKYGLAAAVKIKEVQTEEMKVWRNFCKK